MKTNNYLNKLAKQIAKANFEKGFKINDRDIAKHLILSVSEICEAYEDIRDGRSMNEIYYDSSKENKPCGFPVEIADAIIRLLHICGEFYIDIDQIIKEKLAYNATRPLKHGRKF